jgi:antitoxin component YwqK of YwqJK toxin-antitoxin module
MPKDLIKEENRLYAEYVTSNYEIIETEDINNNKCKTKVKEVIINKINYYMFFRDRCILYKEFTGIQKLWDAYGQLTKHFFHINGKKFGEYKEYFDNGNLRIDCVYVDNGTFKIKKSFIQDDTKKNELKAVVFDYILKNIKPSDTIIILEKLLINKKDNQPNQLNQPKEPKSWFNFF